MDCQQELGHWL